MSNKRELKAELEMPLRTCFLANVEWIAGRRGLRLPCRHASAVGARIQHVLGGRLQLDDVGAGIQRDGRDRQCIDIGCQHRRFRVNALQHEPVGYRR